MDPDRNPHFRSHTGAHYWGIPGVSDSDGGWYVAGVYTKDSSRQWDDVRISQGRDTERLARTVRSADMVSVAMIQDGQIIGHRTIYGPIRDLEVLRKIIERETMVHSPF